MTAEEPTAADETGDRPAAEGSQLASLRDRRKAAEKKLYIDLEVPRLDPKVFVRFKPVPVAFINRTNKRFEKSKDPDVDAVINAVVLTYACEGVFEVVDGKERSVDPDSPEWPKFDDRLAELLGLPAGSTGVDVVRGLYLTDGDVIGTGSKLQEFSGYVVNELERDFQGN